MAQEPCRREAIRAPLIAQSLQILFSTVKNAMAKDTSTDPIASKETMNEADFQASIVARIEEALPLLKGQIRVERYLHLKLGHHEIKINGASAEKQSVKGRSDVVVFLDDVPLVLAELKAPSVKITDDDIDQGLSYARLHQPMVPLVLVTNGNPGSTRFIRTYDGTSVSTEQADAVALRKVLASASELAAESVEGAIRGLLGSEPSVWREMLQRWNFESIVSRSGAVGDFRRSIADKFQIPRDAVKEVTGCLSDGSPVVVLHGPPLAGVTCVMAQLVRNLPEVPCIYVDSGSAGDVLQFIANRLSRELSTGISKDDLRQWLNTGQSLAGLTLLIDGAPVGALDELLDMAGAGLLNVVFGLDSWTWASLTTRPGRSEETSLARLAREVTLTELSNDEFECACKIIWDDFNATFLSGREFVADLRIPRTLRMVVSQIPAKNPRRTFATASGDEYVTAAVIPPIPTYDILERASSIYGADPRLKHDLSRLASAFLADIRENGRNPERVVETFGAPSIDANVLEETAGEQRTRRLSDQGIIHWTDTRSLGPRIVVRLPELLAHHVSVEWTTELRDAESDEAAVEMLHEIVGLSHFVPYGDLSVAAAIVRLKDGKRIYSVARALQELVPEESRLREGAVIELLTTDKKGIRIHFGEGMDERIPGDMQAWLILSHLAQIRADFGKDEQSLNFAIFAGIGNSEDLIYSPPPGRLSEIPGFHFHEIPGLGSLLCASSGIIEPLLQAMYFHAMWGPEEFKRLVQHAVEERRVFLAWRLSIVARIVKNATNHSASEAAFWADAVLKDWWQKTFDAVISH